MNIPDFSANCTGINLATRDTFLGNKTVLFFYPKDMTPGCTKEVCEFRDNFKEILDMGYQIFGVSKDSLASHEKFKEKYYLPFELISDVDGVLCESLDVWQQKTMFGKKYMGLVRSTFIVNEQGQIIKHWYKVSVSDHVKNVIKWLQSN